MPSSIFDSQVTEALLSAQQAAYSGQVKTVTIDGLAVTIPTPFPSPADWRNGWIYFLLTDRFNNPAYPPTAPWNQNYGFRQGGVFNGIRAQLDYIKNLGASAIWISPIVRNSPQPTFAYTYPGYNAQDFLNVDQRWASDGTRATAEAEMTALVNEAHAHGLYVIVDIVINHAGEVFDYVYQGNLTQAFQDQAVLNGPLGNEPPIEWLNADGAPQPSWLDTLPAPSTLAPDDAVWPDDLQQTVFFRRRGETIAAKVDAAGFIPGDFGTMRQLVNEYDASVAGQGSIRASYGKTPVISILIRAYQYLIAQYDIDGFRIDTVEYVAPAAVQSFGNAIREYAISIGKANFFTFGEIYSDEGTIDSFVGRNTRAGGADGFGIDAALDYPLFYQLPNVVKGFAPVETLQQVFETRKGCEAGLISSHGDAGQYFVSFIDNHDQHQRFRTEGTPEAQVQMAVALLFCLQGIPCLYYGTEQELTGTVDAEGNPTLNAYESVREALWGKAPVAFDTGSATYVAIQRAAAVRQSEPPLRFGRLYFREISGNGSDFGFSTGTGGVVAFSRLLTDREVVIVANTNSTYPFTGSVLVDVDLTRQDRQFAIKYSNVGTAGAPSAQVVTANVYAPGGGVQYGVSIGSLRVALQPNEIQIFAPV